MKSFAAAVTVLGVFFATAAVPPALLEFLQQRWRSPTGMLTFAFAVYALSLLVTLLVAGSLSDRAGRRPVLLAACSLQVAVCVVFLAAGSVWWTAAGLIGEWASDPVAWVFVPLLVVFAGAAVFSRLMPETAPGRITGASSAVWRPRAGVPGAVRREFWSGVPMAVATWSLGGCTFRSPRPSPGRCSGSTESASAGSRSGC